MRLWLKLAAVVVVALLLEWGANSFTDSLAAQQRIQENAARGAAGLRNAELQREIDRQRDDNASVIVVR